ncbi:MAG: cryptochrome/photolyase family protein, partial [Proteobacteria bacterium]
MTLLACRNKLVSMANALLILGNQLFDPTHKSLKDLKIDRVFMREDIELCTHFKYHKQKIALFLMAMRSYAEELRAKKFEVDYQELEFSDLPYEAHFTKWLSKNKITHVSLFEIEDKFFETRIFEALKKSGVEVNVLQSPMFLTSRTQFKAYLGKYKRPFMRTFYEQQRKRLKIMVDERDEPIGGKWSFDELNRKPLPKNIEPPEPNLAPNTKHLEAVRTICEKHFADHPGNLESVWFAT